MKNRPVHLLVATSILTFSALSFPALAAEEKKDAPDKRVKVMERVTVIGSQDRQEEIPGSASIVRKETLDRYQYTDVHRALQEVPGVIVQEEDGHGLRPNIAIRGGRSNRSADITLMEDNILTGPAPYAAPEAYYFPQMDRMESLEVIKGTGAVKYGPRTTNGVLNMVTKPIPVKKQADFVAETGSYGTHRTGVTTGVNLDNVGLMLNAVHKETEGFKDLDFVGGDTGYNVQDVLGKLRLSTDKSAERYQELEIKLGGYDEISNETYLGLTADDFRANPNRRYGASQLDQMDNKAWQAAATHFIELTPQTNLTSTLYHNEVDRTWYRLNAVRIGGVRRDIGTIFNDPTANAAYITALQSANSADEFIQRDNARTYFAQGVQSTLATEFALGNTTNKLEIGGRYHQDEEDRYQREDIYTMVGGRMTLVSQGTPGAAGNRVQYADSYSAFVQNEMSWDRWTVTPGLRFEHITLGRDDYGASDPGRTGSAFTNFENTLNVFIPGVGATYAVTPEWKLLGGVHKGFAPPGVPNNTAEAAFTEEEESINYEFGTRYKSGNLSGELIGFLNDYKNLLGRDSFSSGGGGSGDTFNGGEVQVHGLEASVGYDAAAVVALDERYRLPLVATYTHTRSEFKNSFSSSFSEWGNVQAGFELPYMPHHQLYLSAGLETDDWGISFGGKYVSDMRSVAGKGAIPENRLVEEHWVFNVAGEYKITDQVSGFATVDNLFDETYTAALRPAGYRPGMPMTAMAGIKIAVW
jgi:Fe(3+) dicitrate transport protein